MGRLEGKVALVTGAARGQGRSHAVHLAEEGADIVAVDLCGQIDSIPYAMGRPEDLARTAELVEGLDRRIVTSQADVRDSAAMEQAVSEAVAQFGQIYVLCANAGVFSFAPFTELTDELWDDMIGVTLTGVFRTVRAVLPVMLEQERGSIVLTGSTASRKGYANFAHYTAAKHGVVGIMRSLVQEVSSKNIRVNCVLPTTVATDMVTNDAVYRLFDPESPSRESFENVIASMNALPVGTIQPIDISRAVAWLASDESRYVTGICLPVDAGFHEKVG
ncbi:mycofactocin-coupled SDR family oxidoreductase [Pseudonocardia sp. KRD-169]|uniref:Mycofactocin-coupled SDR family oxidoreductase n=2 Tax=Pseudonocardia abyssalis TaxID=2792008 RepID=A0ABS6UWS1_9PSEU|nr:mycofactocin-coupled SDR family oxidoreductase [Pseudonocardia abyssalis]MBW0136671.1 mycofactocin-coupled SDR family oxidoreductase [Pseudonocardia abyssalis]